MKKSRTTWDDLPVAVAEELRAGRPIGVIELVVWISQYRPGALDEDSTSITVLRLLTRFSGPAWRDHVLAVRNWPAYLAMAAKKATLQHHEETRELGHPHDSAANESLVDPRSAGRRLEALEILRKLPRIYRELAPGEQATLDGLLDERSPNGACTIRQGGRTATRRGAARRYRLRRKLWRILFGTDVERPERPRCL
jgi:hypothetical protein